MWHDQIYIQHVAIEGLATAGGIQGMVADACLAVLEFHGVKPIVKWVDDFVLFREPTHSSSQLSRPFYYNLDDILVIMKLLGIPWHDVTKKGQDFRPSFTYIGFTWDIRCRTVHVPEDKRLRACHKIDSILSSPTLTRCEVASVLGTLQHLTFVYKNR